VRSSDAAFDSRRITPVAVAGLCELLTACVNTAPSATAPPVIADDVYTPLIPSVPSTPRRLRSHDEIELVMQHGHTEVLPAVEVVVHLRLACTAGRQDVVHRRRGKPSLVHEFRRRETIAMRLRRPRSVVGSGFMLSSSEQNYRGGGVTACR
jgi:hypothetical protein